MQHARQAISSGAEEPIERLCRSVLDGGSTRGPHDARMSSDTGGCPHYPFAWPSPVDQPKELADLHQRPAVRVVLPSGDEAWLITRHRDVRALLTDPRISKNRNRPDIARMTPPNGAPTKHFQHQVEMDPPGHTRMRRVIAKAFTVARVERLRPRVRAIVTELLDEMDTGARTAELSAAFAHPLSLRVICELLGVPAADRARLAGLTAPPWEYMTELIDRKRSDPGDDLVSDLIRVTDSESADGESAGGARLGETELHWWTTVLLLAGYETTAHQLLSAVVSLLCHDDQLAVLRADLARVPAAVEELLRHQVVGTSLSMLRYATDDIDVSGVTIPKGSSVIPSLECANHDPAAFPGPSDLDITRAAGHQLTFSFGRHFCVGAPLARVELQLGLEELLRRFPGLRLAGPVDRLRRRQDPFTQGFIEVPVAW
jgi:cytochrome P450